jgi:hypothetical protein
MAVAPHTLLAEVLLENNQRLNRNYEGQLFLITMQGRADVDADREVDLDQDRSNELSDPELDRIDEREDRGSDYSPTKRRGKEPSSGRSKGWQKSVILLHTCYCASDSPLDSSEA